MDNGSAIFGDMFGFIFKWVAWNGC